MNIIIDEGTMANQRYLLKHIPKYIPHNVNNDRNVPGAKYRIGDKVYVDNYWKTHIKDVWKDSDGVIWYQIAYPQTRSSTGNDGFKIVKEDYIEGKINESNKQYNMNKKLIKLTESDLHKIVKESVNRIITETEVETGIEYYDKRREVQRSISNVRSLHAKAMKALDELFEACQSIPDEGVKMYLRPSVTVARDKLRGMFEFPST